MGTVQMQMTGKYLWFKRIRTAVLICFWICLILLCLIHKDKITVESIVSYTPDNTALAVVIMLLLFALKSVTFVIYGSILYIVNGILFPLPGAILMNTLGSAIMATIPFWIGNKAGCGLLLQFTERHPKLEIN